MIKKSNILIFGAMIVSAVAARLCFAFYDTPQVGQLCINEIMGKSAAYLYEGSDSQERWIEIFNGTDQDINMNGYGLTNDMDYPYLYRFPDITLKSGGYLVVYATGETGEQEGLYADFELNPRGEAVALTDPDGETVDKVSFEKYLSDSPYGRKPDGGKFALLNKATKGETNNSYISRYVSSKDYSARAVFSHEEGYYEKPFYLTLSCEENEVIFYTTDGSIPDINSKVYQEPLYIEDCSENPNRYAKIRSTENGTLLGEYGSGNVKKGTVIRTRVARDGEFSSSISTGSYFIAEKPSLLTVSLVTEPKNLFDFFDGIYVPGYIYSRFIRSNSGQDSARGNFTLRGKGAERPVSVSFIEEGRSIYNDDSGLRLTSGRGNTANSPVKSLQLMASYKKEEAGKSFPASLLEGAGEEGFKTLFLRSRDQFVTNAMIDVYVNALVKDDGFKVQNSRPVIVYINGEYWGIAYLREKIDEDFIFENFGVRQGNIALLKYLNEEGSLQIALKKGRQEDQEDYLALIDYAVSHDLSQEEHYQYVADRLDIEDYIKNHVVRMFVVCKDWPDNNIRVFRAIEPDGSRYGDGKWRTILFDNDFACLDYDEDMLRYVMGEASRLDNKGYIRPVEGSEDLFVALMGNAGFREALRGQYEEYKKTIFSKKNMNRVLDELLEELGDELQGHAERWSRYSNWMGRLAEHFGAGSAAIDQWAEEQNELERVRAFIEHRQEYMDREFEKVYARYEHE